LVNWQGYDYKMAGKYTYATFGITFNVDINSKIRLAYESWMKMINDPLTNERTLPSEYMVDQVVYLLDYKGIPSMTYKLYGAWPSNLAEVSLDYATADVAQFEVVLTYQFHEAFPGKEQ